MKTKLMLIVCSTVSISTAVAMNEPYQITIENSLLHPIAVLQRNHNNDFLSLGESIDPNSIKIMPLLITDKCELTVKIPHCVTKKIILTLTKDQKDIAINQISKKDIEIIDSNRLLLTHTSYK